MAGKLYLKGIYKKCTKFIVKIVCTVAQWFEIEILQEIILFSRSLDSKKKYLKKCYL